MSEVVVIGAGLTGLTAAFYLKKAGVDVVVVEQCDRTGGQIASVNRDGFIYEKGPNTGTISSPEVAELFEDLEYTDFLETAHNESEKRLIWKGKRFVALPSGLVSAVFTPLFTLKDKFRILLEPFRAKGTNPDESLADLVRRRMGRSFLDYAVDPFLSGIYAGNPEQLITKYAMPKLYALEQDYGGFVKGAIAKGRIKKSARERKATKELFSVRGGFQGLTDRMTEKIGAENIILSAKNVSVRKEGEKWNVSYSVNGENHEISTRYVVSTVGAYRLKDIFGSSTEIDKISTLIYAPVVQVGVGIKECLGYDFAAFGGLVPSREKRDVLGILFPSSCFDGRAPEKEMLFSFFIGGVRNKDICAKSDEHIKEIVYKELREMLNVDKEKVLFVDIFRYEHAIPQYDINQGERLDAIHQFESKNKGIRLAGGMCEGIGIPNRITQGANIASEIISK